MSHRFLGFEERNARWPRLDAQRRKRANGDDLVGITFERQRPLPSACQFQVNVNQDFSVEERSVLHASGPIDPVAVAERVETVRLARVLPPRERKRVDDALDAYQLPSRPLEFRVEEAQVKLGIVDDQSRVPNERDEFVDHAGEERLVLEDISRVAVNARRVFGYVAFGID